jgi:DNA modification methylase
MSETDGTQGGFLSDEQIEEIAGLLRAGRRLPPHLFPHLFETSKESQLFYAGKARRAEVLADTMGVPLQPVKTFGDASESWSNMLILGDNLQVLRRLVQMKDEGQLRNEDGTDGIRLCFIDPPFGTGRELTGEKDQRAYEDRVADASFIEFLRRRLILIYELLASDGTLVVHLDQRKGHHIKVVLDELFGPTRLLNEVIWSYRRWPSRSPIYQRMHDNLFWYRKGPSWPWNQEYESVSESYLRRFGGKTQILDPETGTRKITSEEDTVGMPRRDVWEISIVAPNSPERRAAAGYPTQKPRALIQRFIDAATNPGDLVLDAFAGSGTTAVAAELAKDGPRRWIMIDCGKYAMYVMQRRLLRIDEEQNTALPSAFTMFYAGLYDYEAIRRLPWDEYRTFALQLFQCRPDETRIGGVTFDGYIGDNLVLVYNYHEHPGARIGEAYVNDLSAICRGRLSSRCFIVAPALAVEPYEDYLDVDGTRFFFLRIPYSIIAELHNRAFSELRQPDSKEMTNATIDSVGFDFVQPPRVECDYIREGENLVVTVREFESEAYAAVESDADIADLAMVMVDYGYDGKIFDLDAVYYREDLEDGGYRIEIPADQVAKQLMLIYLDVFGNEHREVKRSANFRAPTRRVRKRRTATA